MFAQGIGFPTVARGKARVRTIVTATHTRDELQFALDAFRRSGASSELSERVTQRSVSDHDSSAAAAVRDRRPVLRDLHRASRRPISSACSRATRPRPTGSSRAASTRRAARSCRGIAASLDYARLLFLAFTLRLTPARRADLRRRARGHARSA